MILVTGATGVTGSAVVRELARCGTPVRALYRDPVKAKQFDGLPGVKPVYGDMLRAETLTDALRDVERVLLISSPEHRMADTQRAFIDAAEAAGTAHLIKISGRESSIGFDPDKFRGTREHVEVERYLEASRLAWTHLRPSQFMNRYLPGALTGVDPQRRELRLPTGDIRLAPVEVEDIAQVAVGLLTTDGHEGKAYDMTGPEALSMTEIAAQISDATGAPFQFVEVSLEDKMLEWRTRGIPESAAVTIAEQLLERARNPKSAVHVEIQQDLGVTPTTFGDYALANAARFLGGRG